MFENSKSLGIAALFVIVSGVLHLPAPVILGVSPYALGLMVIGLIYIGIGWALPANRRWLAWITFFVVMFGGIVAMASAMGSLGVTAMWWALIFIVDWLAALMLFIYLWKSKPQVT